LVRGDLCVLQRVDQIGPARLPHRDRDLRDVLAVGAEEGELRRSGVGLLGDRELVELDLARTAASPSRVGGSTVEEIEPANGEPQRLTSCAERNFADCEA